MAKEDRGFASMDPTKQREIASKGGRAAHQKGTAHEWTSEEARSAAPAPPAPATTSSRPNVLERPWTDAADGPYARAQAVAAERLVPDTRLVGLSPYPDRFRSPVPSPFRYEPGASGWSGGLLFPGLPFPAIGVRPSPPGLGLGRPPGTRR